MNLLKTSSVFPLPASLFLKHSDGKQWWSTWGWLANDQKDLTSMIIRKQEEYGSRLITFMLFNMVDPKFAVVNPFSGNPAAAMVMARVNAMHDPGYDPYEVDRWMGLIKGIAVPSNYLVPTIFCGDDRGTTRNKAFVDWFVPQVIRALYPYVAGYNLISEAGKSWQPNEIDYVVRLCRAEFARDPVLAPKPILVHQQGSKIGTEADALMYEWRFNPWDAQNFSVAQVINELKQVLREYPKDIWPQELAVKCEEGWARDMARAVRELAKTEPRIVGLPGPC